ncbi:MAG: hypothetical protein WBA93_00565 [Microcoleaceae cyanobacterium]
MTGNNIKQQILEHLELLPGEKVKNLLLTWLISSSGNLEYFDKLLTNESTKITEELLNFGEIDSGLNFQLLTEEEMVEQNKLALEADRRQGALVAHDRLREWADS